MGDICITNDQARSPLVRSSAERLLGGLPKCSRGKMGAITFGVGAIGEYSDGCEQINIMEQNLSVIEQYIQCKINKKTASSTVTISITQAIKASSMQCANFTAKNLGTAKSVQVVQLTDNESQNIWEKAIESFTATFKTNQDAKNGFFGQGDGQKNINVANTDIEKLRKKNDVRYKITTAVTNLTSEQNIVAAHISATGDCNLQNINHTDLVSRAIMDVILKEFEKTETVRTFKTAFEASQKTENDGLDIGFGMIMMIIIAIIIIVGVLFVFGKFTDVGKAAVEGNSVGALTGSSKPTAT